MQHDGGALIMRKRSHYRPKAVMRNPLAMMQPTPASRSARLMRVFLTAIDTMARGEHPGVAEWRDLSDAINTIETLTLHQHKLLPAEVMPTVQAAISAMVEASRRFKAGHRMGVDGAGLKALRDVLAFYEQCLEGLTEREMALAQAETQRRVLEIQRGRRHGHTVVSL